VFRITTGTMNSYEIRIQRRHGLAPDIFRSSHIGDHAAVRRAHSLARAGDGIEVWRGHACIYAGATDQPVMATPRGDLTPAWAV